MSDTQTAAEIFTAAQAKIEELRANTKEQVKALKAKSNHTGAKKLTEDAEAEEKRINAEALAEIQRVTVQKSADPEKNPAIAKEETVAQQVAYDTRPAAEIHTQQFKQDSIEAILRDAASQKFGTIIDDEGEMDDPTKRPLGLPDFINVDGKDEEVSYYRIRPENFAQDDRRNWGAVPVMRGNPLFKNCTGPFASNGWLMEGDSVWCAWPRKNALAYVKKKSDAHLGTMIEGMQYDRHVTYGGKMPGGQRVPAITEYGMQSIDGADVTGKRGVARAMRRG